MPRGSQVRREQWLQVRRQQQATSTAATGREIRGFDYAGAGSSRRPATSAGERRSLKLMQLDDSELFGREWRSTPRPMHVFDEAWRAQTARLGVRLA